MSAAQDEFNELMRDKERRTNHPDDDDDARSFLNLSDDDDDRTPPASVVDHDDYQSRSSMSTARHTIPTTRYGANTGPKGVISDAQNYRDSQRMHRTSVRSTSSLASHAQSALSLRDRVSSDMGEKLEELDDEDDGEDDEFMQKWRMSRLRQLQNGGYESNMHRRGRSRCLYGSLTTVDAEGYLEAVEKSPADTVVIVYIYDDMSQVSRSIEECLRTLAGKHMGTRFVKLHYQDAEMEPAGVPALIAYRGGDKFAGLVPIMEEMPEDAELSALTLEAVLQRRQILR